MEEIKFTKETIEAFLQEKMTEGADFKPFRALHQYLLQFICSYYLSDF